MFLKQYQELRSVGIRLSKEVPTTYGTKESLPETVRVLGIAQGKTIILDDEEELNFIMDFYLYEFLVNGLTMLERYRIDHPNLDPIEIAFLDAAKAAYTSLFKVIEVNPKESNLTVIDLLNSSD